MNRITIAPPNKGLTLPFLSLSDNRIPERERERESGEGLTVTVSQQWRVLGFCKQLIFIVSMEMPGRRSNYTLLSQIPDDQVGGGAALSVTSAPQASLFDSSSGDGKNNKGRVDSGFDRDLAYDHRVNQQGNRIGNLYSSIGLQRQSSGSSFGESSLSGEYYAPTLLSAAVNEIDAFGYTHDDGFRIGGGGIGAGGDLKTKLTDTTGRTGGSSSGKSWAQQTEESYQLQLALALRLSSEATCADDPNFLDQVPDESALRSSPSSSAESVSHRFWVC